VRMSGGLWGPAANWNISPSTSASGVIMRHRPRRRVVGAFRPETAFWKITPARGTVSSVPMVPGVSTPRISSSSRRSRSVQRRQRSRKLGPAGQAGLALDGKSIRGAGLPLPRRDESPFHHCAFHSCPFFHLGQGNVGQKRTLRFWANATSILPLTFSRRGEIYSQTSTLRARAPGTGLWQVGGSYG
jgi:hypothetical protein